MARSPRPPGRQTRPVRQGPDLPRREEGGRASRQQRPAQGNALAKEQAQAKAQAAAERPRPRQARGVETRQSILEAAAQMFADRGYDQVTTHQIAARARVSVGALYRYFRNKQAVLHEVYVREVSGLRDRILSGFSAVELVGADPRQVVRKALGLVFRVSAERPGLRRVLAEQSRKIPQLAALRRLADAEVQASARAVLESFPGIRALDVAAAAYFVQLFVEALAEDYILYRPGGQPLGEERVLDAATDLVLRYVLASAK